MNQIENTKNQLSSWVSTLENEYPDIGKIGALAVATIDQIKNLLYFSDKPDEAELEQFKKQHLKFVWGEEAKQLCMMYRDSIFQLYRAKQLNQKNIASERNSFLEVAKLATDANLQFLTKIDEIQSIDPDEINIWKHYLSPIPELTGQLTSLSNQIQKILSLQVVLEEVDRDITYYKVDIEQKTKNYLEFLELTAGQILKIKALLADGNTMVKSDFLNAVKPVRKRLGEYLTTDEVPDLYFGKELKASIPVKLNGAALEVKEIDFKRQFNFWLEAEVIPKLMAIHYRTDQLAQKGILTLSSIEGQLSQELAQAINELDNEGLSSTLHSLHQFIVGQKIRLNEEVNQLNEVVEKDLAIANIFADDRFFLMEPTQLALKEYSQSTRNLVLKLPIESVKKWYRRILQNYILDQNTPTNRKATFDFIDYLLYDVEQEQEVSTFLLKGYLSDSFIVPRTNMVGQVQNSIQLWKKGFQGSALVFGDYLSGRSSFLGAVSYAYLGEHINLTPESVVTWKNHKFETGTNIISALDQIHKMMREEDRLLVIIDDLEIWRNEQHSSYDSLVDLQKAMKMHSHHMYFLISTNHWFKDYLDTYFSMSDVFAELVNTSKMQQDEIIPAVLKRHLATSSIGEIDDDMYELQEEKWVKSIKNIARYKDYNIGASLQEWYRQENGDVKGEEIQNAPKSFIKLIEKHQMFLQYILKFNRISEAEINRELGHLTVRTVQNDIRQLAGKKILKRNLDGSLKINEQLIYYVERALNQILYLTN